MGLNLLELRPDDAGERNRESQPVAQSVASTSQVTSRECTDGHRQEPVVLLEPMKTSLLGIVMVVPFVLGLNASAQGQGALQRPTEWEAHPPLHARPDASTSAVGNAPLQIRHAYGIDRLANSGARQVIAIVDACGSPTVQNDLNVFSDKFGLPRTTVQIVGAKSKQPNAGWALETSLDVQWAHALAPSATSCWRWLVRRASPI